MNVCPNKNDPAWKELVAELGDDKAKLAFFRNGGEIPTLDQAKNSLKKDFHVVKAVEARREEEMRAGISPKEILSMPEIKQRQTAQTFMERPDVSEETKKAITNTHYVPVKDITSVAEVKEIIAAKGPEVSMTITQDMNNGLPMNTRVVMSEQLLKKWDDLAEQAKADGDTNKENYYRANAILLADHRMKLGTEAGRGLHSFAIRLSPDTTLFYMSKLRNQAELPKLTTEQAAKIRELSDAVESAPANKKKAANLALLTYMNELVPRGNREKFMEWLDAYRYNNMLSGPKPSIRNLLWNIGQEYITRPAILTVRALTETRKNKANTLADAISFSDVPNWYKDLNAGMGEAWLAAKEAFKYLDVPGVMDTMQAESSLASARRANTPLWRSFFTRLMAMQDSYGTTLMAAAEKARLMRHGVPAEEATSKALDLSRIYHLREQMGSKRKMDVFSRVFDSAGLGVQYFGRLPVIGAPVRWIQPFTLTPFNAVKFGVETSPLGFLNRGMTKEQRAQAVLGTVVTGVGTLLALAGRTNWEMPKDEKARALAYEAGRKPYSILVGGKWIPIWWFGPVAIAMALPMAAKHFYDQDPKTFDNSFLQNVGNVSLGMSKFLSNMSPLQQIGSFFKFIDQDPGDNMTVGRFSASIVQQAIPYQGMVRWINNFFVDPYYRKARTFKETMVKDMPLLSRELEAYMNPISKTPSKRELRNAILPYDIGTVNREANEPLKERMDWLLKRAKARNVAKGNKANVNKTQSDKLKDLDRLLKEAANQ